MEIKDAVEQTTPKDTDYLIMQDPETGITYKITRANLLAGLSGDSSTEDNSTATSKVLTYLNDGDTNGLFYYLGQIGNNNVWSNPCNTSRLSITSSSVESGSVTSLTDRQESSFFTNSNPDNWVQFSLGSSKLKCNYYSIKTRNNSYGYYPRNWKLQGSNDGSTWDDLSTQIDNTALVNNSQWLSLPVQSNIKYSIFRLLSTGQTSSGYYYIVLGEVELYGEYFN